MRVLSLVVSWWKSLWSPASLPASLEATTGETRAAPARRVRRTRIIHVWVLREEASKIVTRWTKEFKRPSTDS